MCVFSQDVSFVGNTRIFAGGSPGDGQFLVYSMEYQADSDLAMILPLSTPVSPPEDAVRFIDLSNYPRFFDDMNEGFSTLMSLLSALEHPSKPALSVQSVGSFEASFVPHHRDFNRLDRRFRLPEQIWEQLPQYSDYAFAVFKLKAGAKHIHPMAFEFPRRNPKELFFPTVHVHRGIIDPEVNFDHILYCQTQGDPNDQIAKDLGLETAEELEAVIAWRDDTWQGSDSLNRELPGYDNNVREIDNLLDDQERSINRLYAYMTDGDRAMRRKLAELQVPARMIMDITKTKGIVNPEMRLWKLPLAGMHANEDILVHESN